jgi:SAM-dependent methyltransferase
MIVSQESEATKQFRALQIVSLIKLPMQGKIVLDCGCGEGYNASEMANNATKVVGYDPKQDPNWAGRSKENLVLTSDKQAVADHAPFDLIVLYDVIDHVVGQDPEELMKWLAGLLSSSGQVFVRAHPWTSRTGGHVYETANKAFVHLTMTPDELAKAGLAVKEPNLKVIRPMAAYEHWFKAAGLEVEEKRVKTTDVEDFFSGPIMERIAKINWDGKIEPDVARKILANHFIDYALRKS